MAGGPGCPVGTCADVGCVTAPDDTLCSRPEPPSCLAPIPSIPFKKPSLELCVGADSDGAGVVIAVANDNMANDTKGVKSVTVVDN